MAATVRPAVVRRLPIGGEVTAEGVHFRVWAPRRRSVAVVLEGGGAQELEREPEGYFSGLVPEARAGSRYKFQLDGGDAFPDPASRCQPEGPHGPSEVVDPRAYTWRDVDWPGVDSAGLAVYELHVGTFTREGTWSAAARELPPLVQLGINVVEVMPVAEFPGRFGWGYDGVSLFAPTRLYGRPDDMRRFVDEAHRLGLAVILDVVYNHLGPDGNYLAQYADTYFSRAHETEWGEPLNFDGEGSAPVREFFLSNAACWISEFHLDGLRLDATQSIHDASPRHILGEIGQAVRAAGGSRRTYVVAENEPQDARLLRPLAEGGHGLDGAWNDDFHHAAHVALTGSREAYFCDYQGSPQELLSALKYGFLFQGQRYAWQKQRRGTPAFGLPRQAFVNFLQNHDQVANSARGLRGHALSSPGRWRALTAVLLLGPGTPLLFQGQEFSASAPFLYFADHGGGLGEAVRQGRREFLRQFPSLAGGEWESALPAPGDTATFESCRLDHDERQLHAEAWHLHRDLLRLRREDPVLGRPAHFDGAVLGSASFLLRWFGGQGDDRLLVVNTGTGASLDPAPEPLLAPPLGARWVTRWSSESRDYGGGGVVDLETEAGWRLPGECAALLVPRPVPPPERRRAARLPRAGKS